MDASPLGCVPFHDIIMAAREAYNEGNHAKRSAMMNEARALQDRANALSQEDTQIRSTMARNEDVALSKEQLDATERMATETLAGVLAKIREKQVRDVGLTAQEQRVLAGARELKKLFGKNTVLPTRAGHTPLQLLDNSLTKKGEHGSVRPR